jgi:hypothetical protein
MECLAVPRLPEGRLWVWEIKLDGYRAIGVKGDETILYSRNRKNFNKRFPQIAEALRDLPEETVIEGGSPGRIRETGFSSSPKIWLAVERDYELVSSAPLNAGGLHRLLQQILIPDC